jgi:propionyl-CoA synthetase
MACERLDPSTYEWTKQKTGKPVIDHWWQTEAGWAIASNLIGIETLPTKPGSATKPVPGFNVQILDPLGRWRLHRRRGLFIRNGSHRRCH